MWESSSSWGAIIFLCVSAHPCCAEVLWNLEEKEHIRAQGMITRQRSEALRAWEDVQG